MKTNHKLVLTLTTLALSLTIPACGGGGGGGDEGGGSGSASSGGSSSSSSVSAPSSLSGKTLRCEYTTMAYDISGNSFSGDHIQSLVFTNNNNVTWTRTSNGKQYKANGTYTYTRNGKNATIKISGLSFTNGWNVTYATWSLNFHAGTSSNSMGLADVTANGSSYIKEKTFTLKQ